MNDHPPQIHLHPYHLDTDGHLSRTMIVTGYPRQVRAGWADPLLTYPGDADVSLHLAPIPAPAALRRLRHRRARLESAWRTDTLRGLLEDPHRAAAVTDAADLADRVATGETRMFRLAVYITVHAADPRELDAEVHRLSALAASVLVDLAPAVYRPWAGIRSTLPLGTDALNMGRSVDTDALAALMPLAGADLEAPTGRTAVVYGTNAHSGGVVLWDRFHGGLDNYNAVVLARSGAGKSYLAKLELLRSLYTGVQAVVIDPTDEYAHLTAAVGGTRIPLGLPEGRINPFDLTGGGKQAFTQRALFLTTLITAMVGSTDPQETAALNRAIPTAYAAHGITATDPATWERTPPVLSDLVTALRRDAESSKDAGSLADRLSAFTDGTHRGLLDGPTTAHPTGHLTTVTLRHLPAELRTVGLLLVLDALWRRITDPATRRPRLIVIDEGWTLLQDPVGARYVFDLAKNARRHWVGLTLLTQDVADLLATDLGRAVAANAATQILLRQAPQNLDAVCDSFHLSHGERHIVATAERGIALLAAGRHRTVFRAVASPVEHRLITTDPTEATDTEGSR
ncbi:VirB4 family type IV secretion system protein [Nocardiopsis changdeensis]|uniref:DUF87 domain-containing protein n=1 Tax=Nocardiopsis changdeensis TaxID=2831969 RepID=A0ABX8BEF8_9ACTN|nr:MULTISPECIES: DUF87 domain-containing protein [Nocardiopsis]QUX20625.1 DUF87 domain-containing protein [Nocardiopsis changdeensis]QYX36556.1 DUF87 domain-containing protein [Nocardiopsis sp. MT53]